MSDLCAAECEAVARQAALVKKQAEQAAAQAQQQASSWGDFHSLPGKPLCSAAGANLELPLRSCDSEQLLWAHNTS